MGAESLPAASLGIPVNKVRPADYNKQTDCQSFIRKINKEKKLRQARKDELRRREEEKLNEQLEMNRQQENYKKAQKDLVLSRKQAELDRRINERQEQRQKSIVEMIVRTKEITKSQNRLIKDYRFEEPPIRQERDSAADLKA